jgi:hypothetical protein
MGVRFADLLVEDGAEGGHGVDPILTLVDDGDRAVSRWERLARPVGQWDKRGPSTT